jgi:hypothetical protein
VTLTGTLTITTFLLAQAVSGANFFASSFNVAAATVTGTRFDIQSNSAINTFGSGASFFPGNVAGATATGGQYS